MPFETERNLAGWAEVGWRMEPVGTRQNALGRQRVRFPTAEPVTLAEHPERIGGHTRPLRGMRTATGGSPNRRVGMLSGRPERMPIPLDSVNATLGAF
jgi:hypothetical protein